MATLDINSIELRSYYGGTPSNLNSGTISTESIVGYYQSKQFLSRITLNENTINTKIPKNSKITSATLVIQVYQNKMLASENGFKVEINNELVDYIYKPGNNNMIYVNITEELNRLVSKDIENEIITIYSVDNNKGYLSLYRYNTINVKYISKNIMFANNSYQESNCQRAGNGKVNLATGELTFIHPDISTTGKGLNLSLAHVYNSYRKSDTCDEDSPFANYHCGKGFKLNVHQSLLKRQSSMSNNGEEVYTYIDGSGNYHEFTEKFYYKENTEKVYLLKSEVIIRDDQSLYFIKNGEEYEVKKEEKTTSGLKLIPELEGIKGIDDLNVRHEEIVKLEQEIEELKAYQHNLEFAASIHIKNEKLFGYMKEIKNLQEEMELKSKVIENQEITLQYDLKALQDQINDRQARMKKHLTHYWENTRYMGEPQYYYPYSYYKDTTHQHGPSTCQINQNMCEIYYRGDYSGHSNYVFYYNDPNDREFAELYNTYIRKMIETPFPTAKQHDWEYQKLVYLHEDIISKMYGQIEEKRNTASFGGVGVEGLLQIRKAIILTKNILESKSKNYSTIEEEIQESNLNEEKANNKKEQEKLTKLLKSKEKELNKLNIIIPINFIRDQEEKIMGFNKLGMLVYFADKFENRLILEYRDTKLIRIIDQDETVTYFDYEKNYLSKIINSENESIIFKYNNLDQLAKIVYYDNEQSLFKYDEYDNLIEIMNPSESGIKYEYLDSQIINIKNFTNIEKISNDNITYLPLPKVNDEITISYPNYKTTTVTNKHNIKTNYIFDIYGQAVTIYEENDNVQKSISFSYADFNHTFSVVPDIYKSNLLSTAFTGAILSGGEYRFSAPLPSKTNIMYQSVPVNKLVGVTDFVLSGFAKADSAYINREQQTSYTMSEIEVAHVENFDEYKKQRRFELRAELEYQNGEKDIQYCSFDWLNTEWQYIAFPVTIRENININSNFSTIPGTLPYTLKGTTQTLVSLKIFADYSFNTNNVYFKNITLREGKWQYQEYDTQGNPTYASDSKASGETYYYYNDENQLTSNVFINKNHQEFINTYEYDIQGQQIRSIDYNGIISQRNYNEKGQVVGIETYHKDEPSSKFYEESEYDDYGRIIKEYNHQNEEDGFTSYKYQNNSSIVTSTTLPNKQTIAYGNDYKDGKLLSVGTNVDGIKNANILSYHKDLLTKVTANKTDYEYEYDGMGRVISLNIAGINYFKVIYEELSVTYVYANGEETVINYDKYGKITSQGHRDSDGKPSGSLVNTYDDYDNLRNIYSPYDDYSYDYIYENGKVKTMSARYYGKSLSINNDYEEDKITASRITINDETEQYLYHYDNTPDAKNIEVSLPNDLNEQIISDKFGRLERVELGSNQFYQNIHYLEKPPLSTNVISSVEYGVNSSIKDYASYSYDASGNIKTIKINDSLENSYTYDGLSRLIREDNRELNKTKVYKYDGNGNIISRSEYPYTISTVEVDYAAGTRNLYGYKTSGFRDQLISYNDKVFAYDVMGNPTTYKNLTLSWDKVRQLASYNGINFVYDKDGIRCSKDVNGIRTDYYANGNKIIQQEKENETLVFRYGISGLVGFRKNNTEYIYQKNIQGDITHIYDINGNLQAKYIYDAWGNHKVYDALGIENSNSQFIGNINPFRYRSYYYDIETGLYYLNSRYYDPEVGRFINADDISYLDPESINGLNLYAYCKNNPIMYADPSGHLAILIALGITALIATIASVVSQGLQYGWDNINIWQVGVDVLFAIGSVALAATGIGFWVSVALGGIMGFGQYAINSGIRGEDLTWEGALSAVAVGLICGAISGAGAKNSKAIGKSLAKDVGIRSQAGRLLDAVDDHAAGIISKRGMQGVFNLYGKQFLDSVNGAIPGIVSSAFTSSAIKIMVSTALAPGATYLFNKGFEYIF